MTTSSSSIKDGLITHLSAASVIGPNQVSTNYSVMESTAACCAIVTCTSFVSNPMTFGNNRRGTATMYIELKLKDRGDPVTLMNEVYGFRDKVIASLETDDTLQRTVEGIERIEATQEPGIAEQVGSVAWIPVDVAVECSWWD